MGSKQRVNEGRCTCADQKYQCGDHEHDDQYRQKPPLLVLHQEGDEVSGQTPLSFRCEFLELALFVGCHGPSQDMESSILTEIPFQIRDLITRHPIDLFQSLESPV